MPSLLLTNANHVSNKLDDLYLLCDSLSPSVVAITETWLSPNITNDAISINNYHVYRKDRRLHLGGGIMLYVHNDISSKQLMIVTMKYYLYHSDLNFYRDHLLYLLFVWSIVLLHITLTKGDHWSIA